MNICDYFPINVYAFDPFGSLLIKRIYEGKSKKSLVFYINNEHLYPILDWDRKMSVIKTNHIDFLND